jgi:hypothetical protein
MLGIAGAGGAGAQNATGDVQKKLDVFSNEVFINCLKFSVWAIPARRTRGAPTRLALSRGHFPACVVRVAC